MDSNHPPWIDHKWKSDCQSVQRPGRSSSLNHSDNTDLQCSTHSLRSSRDVKTFPKLVNDQARNTTAKMELLLVGNTSGHELLVAQTSTENELPTQVPLPIDRQTILLARAQAEADLELRHKRNGMHQAKHKLKQKKRVKERSENVVIRLQEEIQQLTFQRRVVCASESKSTSVCSVAAEYFRLFRNRYKAPMVKFEESRAIPGVAAKNLSPIEYHAQREFLLATMAPDVTSDREYGVEALLENWMQLSSIFPDIQIQLLRLESVGNNTAVAKTRTTAYFSDETLRRAFPQLIKDEVGFSIAGKLLDHQLSMRGSSGILIRAAPLVCYTTSTCFCGC